MGAEFWAEAMGTRVKPGAGVKTITKGDEEGIQGPFASLFTHSWKLIPLESPTAPREPSALSQGVPGARPSQGETGHQRSLPPLLR